jgi:hypothetical protein
MTVEDYESAIVAAFRCTRDIEQSPAVHS